MSKKKYSRQSYDRLFKTHRYTRETVRKDREYGLFWYDWLWKILRPVLSVLCAFLVIIGLVSAGWNKLYENLISPVYPDDDMAYTFTVASGESATTIARHLEEQEFIRSARVFKYFVQFKGLTNKLQSGVYELKKSEDLFAVTDVITSGVATNERTIRIIPGWNVEDIADYLVKEGALDNREDFLTACRDYRSNLGYSLALISADESADLSRRTYPLEGYLAPDTYRVYLDADAPSIVRTLVKQMDKVYADLFADQSEYDENGNLLSESVRGSIKGLKFSDDEIFILASVIQKEAGTNEDMAKVSAVFYNRLAAGMKLESDPTATYLSGVKRLALTSNDVSRNSDYNTYRISGLPVGPICSPSGKALEAALQPDETFLNENYLFFCAAEPESGKLVFARTYEEHSANVAKYRPLWEAYDREHGTNE